MSSPAPADAYRSKQSLGRAVRRVVSVLPTSPNKKTAVLQAMNAKFHIDQDVPLHEKEVTVEEQLVIDFYLSDEISCADAWTCRDFVTVVKNKKKVKAQKKIMLCTVLEVYQ